MAEVSFMPLPPVKQGQSLRQVGASHVVLLEGSSIPQTPWIIFLLEARHTWPPTTKAHFNQKNVYFFFSTEKFN
ncbi:hypothetical protein [uncultured Roseivirga sp.]|uniref:hypothetical protein n=1 Tax=uncultured Roseivirga sp. TaxID=543088 RepID=UPI00259997E9|nr:hypothetical protein [uncultured Roseivirga sp.]|tara:strand:+ start:522 stop:743 length:222 start_codon:yes stop_codon:yes gene_type:complete